MVQCACLPANLPASLGPALPRVLRVACCTYGRQALGEQVYSMKMDLALLAILSEGNDYVPGLRGLTLTGKAGSSTVCHSPCLGITLTGKRVPQSSPLR